LSGRQALPRRTKGHGVSVLCHILVQLYALPVSSIVAYWGYALIGAFSYNLTNINIWHDRDGVQGTLTGNVTNAQAGWLVVPMQLIFTWLAQPPMPLARPSQFPRWSTTLMGIRDRRVNAMILEQMSTRDPRHPRPCPGYHSCCLMISFACLNTIPLYKK